MERQYPLITCPYCFKKFGHEYVHFKAKSVFTRQDMEQDNRENESMEVSFDDPFSGLLALETQGKAEDHKRLFLQKKDAEYEAFWAKYPGSRPDWEYREYPVLKPTDVNMLKGTFQKDKDGFVFSATDIWGEETKERICPLCHNPLPSTYGKFPVKFISTVGITSSGKTVFLTQLMRNFGSIMARVGMGAFKLADGIDEFLQDHPVKKGVALPLGNTTEALSKPLFYNIRNQKNTYTLVFYDIAGENCTSPDGMSKFGPFIRNADGIIMILDPKQFRQIGGNKEETASPETVLTAMYSAFLDSDNSSGKTKVPLAVAFSKSDTLMGKEFLPESSNIFQDISYPQAGFNVNEFRNVNGEVRGFLNRAKEGKQLLTTVATCFERFGLFAFSALRCDVRAEEEETGGRKRTVYKPVEDPEPLRIEEALLWILAEENIIPKCGEERHSSGLFGFFGKRR